MRSSRFSFFQYVGILLAGAAVLCHSTGRRPAAEASPATSSSPRMPLVFERNRGQANPQADFVARGRDYTLGLGNGTERYRFQTAAGRCGALSLELLGAGDSQAIGRSRKEGVVNYLYGKDPRNWITGVQTFARVDYLTLYPGIDLTYYFNENRTLERDFVVKPGADPAQIRYRLISSRHRPRVDQAGGLQLTAGAVRVRQDPPIAYQLIDGRRRPIEVAYSLVPSRRQSDESELTFRLGSYDRQRPLIIDPVRPRVVAHQPSAITPPTIITFKTYTGTTTGAPQAIQAAAETTDPANAELADDPLPGSTTDLALTDNGDLLACGATNTIEFPTSDGATQRFYGGGTQDAWVARVDPLGREFRFCTYFGGIGEDRAFGVRLDANGNPCIVGFTDSDDLPTVSPFQAQLAGGTDAFVAVFSPNGAAVRLASYIGGTGDDFATALARDNNGKLYVTGRTSSVSSSLNRFPSTPGAFQQDLAGIEDAFLTKVDTAARRIEFSTFFGGNHIDRANALHCAADGTVTIVGQTQSSNLPLKNPSQSSRGGGIDAFAARFKADGSDLEFATYLGGGATDAANEVTGDPDGAIYVIGETLSTNFPTGRGASTYSARNRDGFLARLPATGGSHNALLLSGAAEDIGFAVHAPDPNVSYLTGTTTSSDFIGAASASRRKHDFFVSEVVFGDPSVTPMLLGSFVESGNAEDGAYAITTRDFPNMRRVFLAGKTSSTDLTTTTLDPNRSPGDTGQFLMAFDDRYVEASTAAVKFRATKVRRSSKARLQLFNREAVEGAFAPIFVGTPTGPFSVLQGGGKNALDPNGSHTIVLQFKPIAKGAATGELQIVVSDPFPRALTITLKGKGKR